MIGIPEKQDRLCIVDSNGSICKYMGKELRFDAHERERAEMILFLLERNAVNGPFRLIPLIEQ